MGHIVTQDDLERAKKNVRGREGTVRRTWFSKERPTLKVKFIDPTFTVVFKGEAGLDGKTMEYDEAYQILLMNYTGSKNGRAYENMLSLWASEFALVAEAIEKAGGNYLDLKDKTYEITLKREERTSTAQLLTITDDNYKIGKDGKVERKGATVGIDDQDLLEMALDVYKEGWEQYKLRVWLQERLDNEGITVTEEQMRSVCEKVCGSAKSEE